MTAINIIRKTNELHIFSDGALIDAASDKIHWIAPKVALLPHMQAALICRGAMALMIVLASDLRVESFEAALAAIPATARKCQSFIRPYVGRDPTASEGEVHFCGWSAPRLRFEHWMMPTDDRYGGDHPAFEIKLQDDAINAAPLSEAIGRSFVCPMAEDFDPVDHGLVLMELQRAHFGSIGGFLQHTVIDRREIRSSIIHRWPDKPGDLLRPTIY